MRSLYGKLWTEFFSSFYGPSVKHAGHENREGKNEDPQLAVRTKQTRLIRCLLYGFVDYSGFEKVIESYTGGIIQWLDTDVHSENEHSAVTVKASTAL